MDINADAVAFNSLGGEEGKVSGRLSLVVACEPIGFSRERRVVDQRDVRNWIEHSTNEQTEIMVHREVIFPITMNMDPMLSAWADGEHWRPLNQSLKRGS